MNDEDIEQIKSKIENLRSNLLRIFEEDEVTTDELATLISSFIPFLDDLQISFIDDTIIEEMGIRHLQYMKNFKEDEGNN